jgi:hypothetical protein
MGEGLEQSGGPLVQPGGRLRLLGLGGAAETRGEEGGAEHDGDGGDGREKTKGQAGLSIEPWTGRRQSGPARG